MIYFIQAGEDGPIKIGRSKDEAGRFGGLQTASYERLHLRAVLDVPDEIENHFHTILSGARIRGEWFDSKETIVNIALACALAGYIWEPTCADCGEKAWADKRTRIPRMGQQMTAQVRLAVGEGTSGIGRFFWVVDDCPYCGQRHTHNGGSIKDDDPRAALGLRAPHCHKGPEYLLVEPS